MSTAVVAFQDLGGSIQKLPLALQLALDDIHGKYRRTILGPLWITFGQAATIGGFVVVFSGLFNIKPEQYLLYLAAGFPVWALISLYLTDMPNAFIAARGIVESFETPWLTQIWRRAIGNLLIFLHQLVTLFAAMAYLKVTPSANMLLIFPALGVVLLGGMGIGMTLAVLGARYRDLQPAMQIAASFLFFFTPVMWRPEQLQINQWVLQYNPFAYLVRLARDPLLGQAPPADIWIGATATAAALFVIGFWTFLLSRRRLYHWL